MLGTLGLVVSAIAVPGMFLVSQPVHEFHGLATASITDSDAIRFLIVGSLQNLLYTLGPFSIAWLLRGAASAIAASIGFHFLSWMIAPLLPLWVKANVLRYLPDKA